MRILIIHQYFLEDDDPGGSRFNEMAKSWTDLGHKVTVLAGTIHYNQNTKRAEYKKKTYVKNYQGKVEVFRCFVSEGYNKNFLGRLWGYISFVFSSTYVGLFKAERKFDVILVTSPPLFVGINAIILSFFKRVPYVFEVRDLWPESAIDTDVLTNKYLIKLSYWLEKIIYKKAKLINVLTPAFRAALINEKKVPEDKIIFIPNAADFTLSEDLLNNFKSDEFRKTHNTEDKFVITYVGAHGVANHLIQLIHVAERLKNTPIVFQLIGDGMEKIMLKQEVLKRNLQNVIFIDSVPKKEVFKYILASDLGVSVLKKVETFKTVYSNKTFDYMACKKPILMLIDGVSRELVETAKCGIYAEPENIEEIVNGIHFYLQNRKYLEIHGDNGYRYAQENFDRSKLSLRYLKNLIKVQANE
jgi:glycosyltransferase involved in cell wall biosynthesis